MEVLNVKELASYLSCSVSAVRSLVRERSIPYFRIGSKINFNKEAIDIWVHNQEISNMQDETISQNEIKPLKNVGVI